MKKIISSFLLCVSLTGSAQTFHDSTFSPIFDTTKVCVPIIVSGLPNQLDTAFGLSSFCFNITHTFDADLVLQLVSPNGTTITLAGGVGGNGINFTNTCLAENGTNGAIAGETAPFTGAFIPQQSLNIFNNGQNPNGTWKFCISDTYFGDTGSVHNFNITFTAHPPPDPPAPPVVCSYCACANSTDTCDLLPDMTASAMCIQQNHFEGPGSLIIANATPNIGRGPMEVHGLDSCFCDTVPVPCNTICPTGQQLKHIVVQRIYQRVGNDTLLHHDRIAGKMIYHPSHGHLHIDHWADYSLRVQTPDPDATDWPVVGSTTKQSFCLVNEGDCTNDFGYCKDSLGNTITTANIPNAGFGLYTGCGLDQGIYPGNLDVYDMQLNDPIILNNICDGTYYIVSITDPENKFLESNENNNWVSVPVTLTKQNAPAGTASFNFSVNGLQTTFTNTSPAGNTYLWNFGDGSWDTTYSPIHTYTAIGTYSASLVSLNQCYSMSSQEISITGINEYNHADLNLHIYQNPLTENSFITYFLPEKTNVKIELTDITGKEIAVLADEMQLQGLQKYYLKSLNLMNGIYLLNVQTDSSKKNILKLIKAK